MAWLAIALRAPDALDAGFRLAAVHQTGLEERLRRPLPCRRTSPASQNTRPCVAERMFRDRYAQGFGVTPAARASAAIAEDYGSDGAALLRLLTSVSNSPSEKGRDRLRQVRPGHLRANRRRDRGLFDRRAS